MYTCFISRYHNKRRELLIVCTGLYGNVEFYDSEVSKVTKLLTTDMHIALISMNSKTATKSLTEQLGIYQVTDHL